MDSSQRYPGQLLVKWCIFGYLSEFSSDSRKLNNLQLNNSLEPRYGQIFYRVEKQRYLMNLSFKYCIKLAEQAVESIHKRSLEGSVGQICSKPDVNYR